MEELYLPVLSHFQNKNVWTASVGRARYRVTPQEDCLEGEAWEGPWCYECSQVEEKKTFPMEEQGLDQVRAWVGAWAETMNARPAKTLAESIALRDVAAKAAAQEA